MSRSNSDFSHESIRRSEHPGERPSKETPIRCRVCDRVFCDGIRLLLHFEPHLREGVASWPRLYGRSYKCLPDLTSFLNEIRNRARNDASDAFSNSAARLFGKCVSANDLHSTFLRRPTGPRGIRLAPQQKRHRPASSFRSPSIAGPITSQTGGSSNSCSLSAGGTFSSQLTPQSIIQSVFKMRSTSPWNLHSPINPGVFASQPMGGIFASRDGSLLNSSLPTVCASSSQTIRPPNTHSTIGHGTFDLKPTQPWNFHSSMTGGALALKAMVGELPLQTGGSSNFYSRSAAGESSQLTPLLVQSTAGCATFGLPHSGQLDFPSPVAVSQGACASQSTLGTGALSLVPIARSLNQLGRRSTVANPVPDHTKPYIWQLEQPIPEKMMVDDDVGDEGTHLGDLDLTLKL